MSEKDKNIELMVEETKKAVARDRKIYVIQNNLVVIGGRLKEIQKCIDDIITIIKTIEEELIEIKRML